jgi:hypothetical protein
VKGRGEQALHRDDASTRKLKMKYIVLDRNDGFDRITSDRNLLEPGALYQVSEYNEKEQGFPFNRVKDIDADLTLTLTKEQHDILKKVMVLQDYKSLEQYVNDAVLSILKADADHCLPFSLREEALKVLEEDP